MGGWDKEITQNTVIVPSLVAESVSVMDRFVNDFNQFLSSKDVGTVKLGHPTGSSAYYKVDPADKIYGDIDLQLIVPNAFGMTNSQIQSYWYKLEDEFIKTVKPRYVYHESEPGHPILRLDDDTFVQVDLMPHPEQLATWGRYRTTPERGIKGLLNGNMFSVLGEMLTMSIQHSGVQYKAHSGAKQPYVTTRKNYVLHTITIDIERFVRDIFDHEYELIFNEDADNAVIDRLLLEHPGSNIHDVKIANLVRAVVGLARSFEANSMYGKGDLVSYSSAEDFISKFLQIYEQKALKDINANKRDKASTPQAIARAEDEREKIREGLETVKKTFSETLTNL